MKKIFFSLEDSIEDRTGQIDILGIAVVLSKTN